MAILSKLKNFFKGAVDNGANITEQVLKRGESLYKQLDKPDFINSVKSLDDSKALVYYVGKNADTLGELSQTQKINLGRAFKNVKTGTDVVNVTGKSVGEAGKALTAAKDFFQRNEKTLLTAGLTVGAIATLMLLTGESDPAKAIGEELGVGLGAVGDAAGKGAKSFFDGLGIGDFFSKWGLYIGIFCAILLMLGVFMMLK